MLFLGACGDAITEAFDRTDVHPGLGQFSRDVDLSLLAGAAERDVDVSMSVCQPPVIIPEASALMPCAL